MRAPWPGKAPLQRAQRRFACWVGAAVLTALLLPSPVALLTALLLPSPAAGQVIEALFPAGQSSDGYYVPYNGSGKLVVGVLAGLEEQRPITLGARVRASGKLLALQTKHFESDVELFKVGRRSTLARDQWYLQGFAWVVSCNKDGEVTFNGDVLGPSPAQFVIEVGVVREVEETVTLSSESIAASSDKQIVCGELAPLPAPAL